MATIEVIDESTISWVTGSDFDLHFQAMVDAAAESGAIECIDETAVTWRTGSDFDRSLEAAAAAALKHDPLATVPASVVG